jgi:hypothetical protein
LFIQLAVIYPFCIYTYFLLTQLVLPR